MSYPVNEYQEYHAHVYFDAASVDQARCIWQQIQDELSMGVGRFHERPVGPHPYWSFQIAFNAEQFTNLIPWLDKHRDTLTVLVHPVTGDELADHKDHAKWLGEPAVLDLTGF